MDKESKICMECEVRKNCPTQKRADRITSRIDRTTLSPEDARSEFSRLQQELAKNHCPPSEKSRLVSPLRKRIHPNRNPDFNTSIIRSHPAQYSGYSREESADNREFVSRTRGVKARRTTR